LNIKYFPCHAFFSSISVRIINSRLTRSGSLLK
jgi:hypothetical protein